MSKQATTTTVHEARWTKIGDKSHPKGKRFVLATATKVAQPGDRFTVTSNAGVIQTGTLDSVIRVINDRDMWEFTTNTKSASELAADKVLNAQARALRATETATYWASDAGAVTASKIQARLDRANVTPSTVTPAPAIAPSAVQSAVELPSLIDLLSALIGAGIDPVSAATQAVATLAALTSAAPVTVAPVTPSAVAPVTSAKRVRTAAQLANDARLRLKSGAPITSAPAQSAQLLNATPQATTARRLPCDACGKQDHLTGHAAHPALHVCPSCLTADGSTVATRAVRRALKAK